MNQIRYYKNVPSRDTFAPEIHEWIAAVGDRYLFVLKDTDRLTPIPLFQDIGTPVPTSDVPAPIRRKAGQRLGGFRTSLLRRSP